jgi:hypothetical protein
MEGKYFQIHDLKAYMKIILFFYISKFVTLYYYKITYIIIVHDYVIFKVLQAIWE